MEDRFGIEVEADRTIQQHRRQRETVGDVGTSGTITPSASGNQQFDIVAVAQQMNRCQGRGVAPKRLIPYGSVEVSHHQRCHRNRCY